MAKQKIKVIREEMLQVANNVAQEKSIDKDSVFEAMELALEKAARVKYGFERDIRVNIDRDNGDIKLNSFLEVVENLSGGERQGVVIARALYFRTKVLIMDEPTNHLSVKETDKVLRWIEKLKAEGTTCIFITHNLHHVYPVSDRLVVFARGEKIAMVIG